MTVTKLKCLRCEYKWFARPAVPPRKPKYCPHCKSPKWDKERVK
jgi:predicted Zn-ribbon and HTH transcriptional regulator